jgi:hypothetical protein
VSGRYGWALLAALVVAGNVSAGNYRARFERIEEPQGLKLQITSIDTGLLMEGDFEQTSLKNGPSSTYERFFIAPTLGLSLQGSVYHPNFLRFQFTGEGAFGWEDQIVTSGAQRNHSQGTQMYGNFQGSAQFLANKPLNGSLSAGYARTFRDYDFFTRVTVDTLNYGGSVNYQIPWLSLGATYSHTEEDVFDPTTPYNTKEDLVSLDARNDRHHGATSLNYTYNQYAPSAAQETFDHTVNLSDNEKLGAHEQIDLGNSITASHRDDGTAPEDQLSAYSSLTIKHDPKLTSNYYFNFDQFEVADYQSDTYTGNANVQHQLYDSLYSYLSVAASSADSSSDTGSGYSHQFGGGISESYSKQLGSQHHLRIDGSLFVNHIDEKSTGRAIDERHVFPKPPNTESFLLNLPNVIELTIVVSDVTNLRVFVRGIDYEVFPSGERTEIRRVIGGSIPEGSIVRVDYQALPTAPASYETFSEAAGIRFDFWNNFWGIYARMSHTDNNAPLDVHVLASTRYVFGTDLNWRWLQVGGEYENYDSTDSTYWSARLYQSSSFTLDSGSTLGVGLTESYTEHPDDNRQEQNYRVTLTYRRPLITHLTGSLQAGAGIRRGTDVDQTLAVVRPELSYTMGRTTILLSYEFGYNLYLNNEERIKNYLMLRIRRTL